ncbi:putative ran-binding protein [Schistosoma mansoni]|uniref:Putative ran-binding protein n=1 Tax=Schistosoma mansoni TaxID=6183 RepID=A0A3Q0KI45_SCHMA|nr:putative ran-binding protein [Schistosoma mansoni]|eukprot:XP_018654626.1 putative ran-binding protein [Schistosoma mansoni]
MESNANLEEVQINVNGTNHPQAKSIEQNFSSSIPNHSVSCTEASTVSLETPNDLPKSPTILSSSTVTKKEIPSDYVFGSNISSRVVNADVSKGASVNLWTSTSASHDSASCVFTTLAKAVTASQANFKDSKNLEDSAKEVAEDKRKETLTLAEVDLVTGEEGEIPIIRQHCRAHIFDANKQKWNNLGAVHFHLNDIPNDSVQGNNNASCRSRIVVRLVSTRRLLINTLIWSQMPAALVDSRTLRIGAINEEGHIKNYLFGFPPDESASKIFEMISFRKSNATTLPYEIYHDIAPVSNKDKVTGCKRQLEIQAKADVDCSLNVPPKIANTNILSPTPSVVVFPKTNVFRPSVFAPVCKDSSNNSSTPNHSCHVGELQFRNSPLDNVVKRLCESNPSGSSESSTLPCNNKVTEPPKLSSSVNSQNMPISSVSSNQCTDFIFGHNVSERVTNASLSTVVNRDISGKDLPVESSESNDHSLSPEKEESVDASETGEHCTVLPSKQTLEESAAAVTSEMLEKSTYLLANLPESPILTGEEGEYLTLKAYCHFYCFDRHKHEWVGRGQAYIHLNDVAMKSSSSPSQVSPFPSGPPARSRLVIRTCQTLKLLANVPIWSGLNVAMADERSIRLTTVCHPSETLNDSQNKPSCSIDSVVTKPEFCAYLLVMHSHKEADRLFQALNSRINTFTSRLNAKPTYLHETNSASNSPGDFSSIYSRTHGHLEEGDDSPSTSKVDEENLRPYMKLEIDEPPKDANSQSMGFTTPDNLN